MPLDRSGQTPGTISLSLALRPAGAVASSTAVVALAGGPGQPALPVSQFLAQAIGPALATRDLLVFDQRGTGKSDPLSCSAFQLLGGQPVDQVFRACATQLGPARGAFTTQESVEDIEALRVAGGYRKLVLYGTSYGTKVALEYAQRYPQHVEALVLDSVVPVEGPEPFAIPTFNAIAGVIGELCAHSACAAVSANPVADIAALAARLSHRAIHGTVYDGLGRRHTATLDENGLLEILEAGDLNPALRALAPAAVRSALHSDPDPLLRLHLLSEGLIPNVPREENGERSEQEIDGALFATTTCEESPFPWARSAPASTRRSEALSFLHAQPPAAFYPFDAATAFSNSLVADCAAWPDASPPPPGPGSLPNVPTLILSGEQDLRTPTTNARRVASLIPDAQLLLVPFTGHSVLGSDLGNCAATAVATFFAGNPVSACTTSSNFFSPTAITPTRLAGVRAPSGLRGRPGQTLTAVLDTLVDLNRQVIAATLQGGQRLPSGSSFGGLHGGYARLTASRATLKDFSFVPGVRLTANFHVRGGVLQATSIHITGAQASHGSVRYGASAKRITGTLAGRHFNLSLARVRIARSGPSAWPSPARVLALLARGGHPAPRPARALLPWLP